MSRDSHSVHARLGIRQSGLFSERSGVLLLKSSKRFCCGGVSELVCPGAVTSVTTAPRLVSVNPSSPLSAPLHVVLISHPALCQTLFTRCAACDMQAGKPVLPTHSTRPCRPASTTYRNMASGAAARNFAAPRSTPARARELGIGDGGTGRSAGAQGRQGAAKGEALEGE
jgi:hypothetical protein